ncbi:hypothetical protein [Pseudomonas sp. zjy_14]|uniref:phage tailspike polysaccharide lyase family protein n=1 Tax=Pseudomonas sp. zjy_14 TaxID=3367264 RepID=UPI00370B3174
MRYNTGNPVGADGSSSPFDLHDNSGNIDVWANDRSRLTWPDRLGVERKTFFGMEQQVTDFLIAMGYESVYLVYGAGVVVERQTQLVQRDGELYRVMNASDVPLTLTGTWATDAPKLQAVGDAALRAALATNSGASMVGFRFRNVSDRFNDTAIPKDHGAIADGNVHLLSERYSTLAEAQLDYPFVTSLSEDIDWAAIQSALNTGARRIRFTAGHYRPTKGNTRSTDVVYEGDGYASRVDYSSAGVNGCLLTQGSLTQIGGLASSVLQGARSLTFAAAPDLVPGDVVIIYNPTDGSWLSDRAPYRAGEMWRVHSVSGNVVTIYGNSTSNYTSGQVLMYRLRGVRCSVDQLHFTPSDTYSIAPFKVVFGDGVKVSNYYASDVDLYTGLEVERSFDVSILACSSPNRSPAVGDEYGITISNCQNFTISSGSAAATRHAIALGGMDDVACVPNRNGLIYGMIIEGIDLPSDIGAGDMHGNADKITYDNCIFRNGAIMQGRDATIRNSLIYGVSSTAGECIYGTEVYGGTYTIENNRFVSYGNAEAFGYVHISPSTSLAEKLHVVLRGNTFEVPNATASSKVCFLRGRNSPRAINGLVVDLHVTGATVPMQCFLFADDQVKTELLSDYLIIDRVFGPAGTYLLYPTSKNANVPTRQMRQTGWVNLASSAAQVNAAPAQSFRYPYSKIPNAPSPGVYLPSGTAHGLVGSVVPIGKVYELTSSTIRPAMLAASGSFAEGSTVRLSWEAAIDDI